MDKSGPGLVDLTLAWAWITQCLCWAGVVEWSWMAVWLPFILAFVLNIISLVIIELAGW